MAGGGVVLGDIEGEAGRAARRKGSGQGGEERAGEAPAAAAWMRCDGEQVCLAGHLAEESESDQRVLFDKAEREGSGICKLRGETRLAPGVGKSERMEGGGGRGVGRRQDAHGVSHQDQGASNGMEKRK